MCTFWRSTGLIILSVLWIFTYLWNGSALSSTPVTSIMVSTLLQHCSTDIWNWLRGCVPVLQWCWSCSWSWVSQVITLSPASTSSSDNSQHCHPVSQIMMLHWIQQHCYQDKNWLKFCIKRFAYFAGNCLFSDRWIKASACKKNKYHFIWEAHKRKLKTS